MNAVSQALLAVESVGAGQPLTMSSREIAELCEKQHQHVRRDIEAMCQGLDLDPSNFGRIYQDARNRDQQEYCLSKNLTLTLIAGYNVKLRARIIDRWMELEGQTKPLDYSDPRVLLGVMSHLQAQVVERDAVIVEQGTRLKTLDRLEGAQGSMCITDAAKTLGQKRAQDLFDFMSARRWIFKRPGNKNWLAYQDKIQAGYMEHEDHIHFDSLGRERVSTRALVTAKGLVKLADLLEQPKH